VKVNPERTATGLGRRSDREKADDARSRSAQPHRGDEERRCCRRKQGLRHNVLAEDFSGSNDHPELIVAGCADDFARNCDIEQDFARKGLLAKSIFCAISQTRAPRHIPPVSPQRKSLSLWPSAHYVRGE